SYNGCDLLTRTLESNPQYVFSRQQFAQAVLYTLAPVAPPPAESSDLQAVPTFAIQARASHSPDRVRFLFDEDLDSRWLTGVNQNGNEWIDLEFDRPRDIRRVRLQMAERSVGDYPRGLEIDLVDDGVERTAFHGSVLPQWGRSLV